MTDPEKQAAFIDALRKKAEEAAAKDPVLADMRLIGKALLHEARKRIADGNKHTSIAAYLKEGTVSLIEPEATDATQAGAELLSNLRQLAQKGNIQAAALCEIVPKQFPGGSVEKFVSVHTEHSTGKAVISQMPADEAVLMRGVPGASGPAIGMFGGPTNPKIFASQTSNKPIRPTISGSHSQ
jgi:hypothetical protein